MTLKRDEYNNQVQAMHPYLSQAVTASSTVSTASAPFTFIKEPLPPVPNTGTPLAKAQRTMHIRIVSTVNCWISFGTAPVAAKSGSTSMFIPAGIPEYFWVRPGERVGVLGDAATGALYVTELANN